MRALNGMLDDGLGELGAVCVPVNEHRLDGEARRSTNFRNPFAGGLSAIMLCVLALPGCVRDQRRVNVRAHK